MAASAQLRYYYRNREAVLARKRETYNTPREKSVRLQRRYGISVEDWDALFSSQGDVCAICGTDAPCNPGWCLDHDHDSGKIRGILCPKCNFMLGYSADNVDNLMAGWFYLMKHQES